MSGVLVHEWLSERGGSENVFERLSELYPDADRYCLWNDSAGRFSEVSETWLARTPLKGRKALALPLMPAAWRTLPRSDADWVLCSSHLFAHHARFSGPAANVRKLIYAHTPARYIWDPDLDGRGRSSAARMVSRALQPLDRRRAQEAHAIAANSEFVRERIRRAWRRDAIVIHPPVDVDRFSAPSAFLAPHTPTLNALPERFLLGVSRFIPYKRLDLVIAAGAAASLPVVLAGSGSEEAQLRHLAAQLHPDQVHFVIAPSSDTLAELYRRAAAVVFPPIEDFGIVPVEAMAAGTPVIANAIGGAAESVVPGVTGAIVDTWEASSLRAAVEVALASDPAACVARAQHFSNAAFDERIAAWVDEEVS